MPPPPPSRPDSSDDNATTTNIWLPLNARLVPIIQRRACLTWGGSRGVTGEGSDWGGKRRGSGREGEEGEKAGEKNSNV